MRQFNQLKVAYITHKQFLSFFRRNLGLSVTLYAMVNKIKILHVKFTIHQWLENFHLVGPVECTSLITRIAQGLGVLNWAKFSYIEAPCFFIDENYLVFGHTHICYFLYVSKEEGKKCIQCFATFCFILVGVFRSFG